MTSSTQGIPRVAPTLVTDQVYTHLEAAILNGDIEGGTRLRVRQVAEMVGTSVMPVREAIRRLEDSGLAEREAHKGAVVKEFSIPDLIKVYSVRLLLEPEAARLGALNMTEKARARMTDHLAKFKEELDQGHINRALEADTGFLGELYRLSENDVLGGMIDTLWKQSHLYRVTVLNDDRKDGGRRTFDCNVEILESAGKGDEVEAEAWVRKSIQKSIHTLTHLDRNHLTGSATPTPE